VADSRGEIIDYLPPDRLPMSIPGLGYRDGSPEAFCNRAELADGSDELQGMGISVLCDLRTRIAPFGRVGHLGAMVRGDHSGRTRGIRAPETISDHTETRCAVVVITFHDEFRDACDNFFLYTLAG